jgi:hypothetical protein
VKRTGRWRKNAPTLTDFCNARLALTSASPRQILEYLVGTPLKITYIMVNITDAPLTLWSEEELSRLKADYPDIKGTLNDAISKYNPTPGKFEFSRRSPFRLSNAFMRPRFPCFRYRPYWVHPRSPQQLSFLQRRRKICASNAS